MSKEELSKKKYIRQQPAPDRPSSGKSLKEIKKPWLLEWRFTGAPKGSIWNKMFKKGKPWKKRRAYKNEKGANQALLSAQSDPWEKFFEYRVRHIEAKEAVNQQGDPCQNSQ